jgi:hypothetical protein
MTFTVHGWGAGLLQADLIEEFLVHYFALSAHAYTRGSWIAPESTVVDRNQSSVSFCTPATLTAPILLKWLLVWEHPVSHTLWLGKAIPRVWLSEGETVAVTGAGTAHGKVSIAYTSQIESHNSVAVNISVEEPPACWGKCEPPPGGLALRLRTPGKRTITKVLVGGEEWTALNASSETVIFAAAALKEAAFVRKLQDVVVSYKPKV